MGTDVIGGDRHNLWGHTQLVGTDIIGGDRHNKLRYRLSNIEVVGWSVGRSAGRAVPDDNNTTLWPNLQVETCKVELN